MKVKSGFLLALLFELSSLRVALLEGMLIEIGGIVMVVDLTIYDIFDSFAVVRDETLLQIDGCSSSLFGLLREGQGELHPFVHSVLM